MKNHYNVFKTTYDGQYLIMQEKAWLFQNERENDGFTPRPVPDKFFEYVFLGTIKEYLNTDYNITQYKWNANNRDNTKFIRKWKFAIQMIYPYIGSDDRKLGKHVISLYLVGNDDEVFQYRRIWEEL
jgi:hypothetical protein